MENFLSTRQRQIWPRSDNGKFALDPETTIFHRTDIGKSNAPFTALARGGELGLCFAYQATKALQ
jgi:hypothetical protein